MEFCPHCGANTEGLIHHCDCCGQLLHPVDHLFWWHTAETCADFGTTINIIVEELEQLDASPYEKYIKSIELNYFCLTEEMFHGKPLRNRVYYSSIRKNAILTFDVEHSQFAGKEKQEKLRIVAIAIQNGLHTLQERLLKRRKIDISGLVSDADKILSKYL